MLAVPLMLPAVAGTKSIASVQLVPGAKVDGGELALNCGQLLLLSCAKLVEMLGFWPDAGAMNVRGALPIFVADTVCVLVEPISVLP